MIGESEVLNAIDKASREDLAAIDKLIASMEERLDVLYQLSDMLHKRFDPSGDDGEDLLVSRRRAIAKVIRNSGPKSIQRLCESLKISRKGRVNIFQCLECEWFRLDYATKIVTLTPECP